MRAADRRRAAVVGIDQWGAMEEVVRLLVGHGHRSALYIAGPSEWRDAATRLKAWKRLAAVNSISSTIVQCDTWQASEAYARMNHVLEMQGSSGSSGPTVVVTANDSQAVGVARAMHEHGLRIPQDVSLVGFDDMPAMDNMYPPLTTVRPDFEQLGMVAMQEVLRLLGTGEEPSFNLMKHGVGLIPAKVLSRGSLGPVPRI